MKCRTVLVLALLALLIASGCGKYHRTGHHGYGGMEGAAERAQKEVSALLGTTLQDPGKVKQAQDILEQILSEVKQTRQQNRESHQQLYELNTNYDAEQAAFRQILDGMNTRRKESGLKILGYRFDLKELMTREEWKTFTDGLSEMRSRYRAPTEKED